MEIKKILKTLASSSNDFFRGVGKGYFWFFFLIPFWALLAIIYITSKDIDNCVSEGKIWDPLEDFCREDCLLWNKNLGCVKFTPKMMEQLQSCTDKECNGHLLGSFVEELCLKYEMPYDKERNQCFWTFTPDMCHKLPGNWQYPKVCDN